MRPVMPRAAHSAPSTTDDRGALLARVRQGELLAELGRRVVAADDLDALMQGACGLVAEGFGVRHAKLLRLLDRDAGLAFVTGVGWAPGTENVVMPMDSSPGYAVLQGRSIVTEDTATETRFAITPLIHAHGLRSMVNAVVPTRAGAFGVLEADGVEPRTFTAYDLAFLEACAGLVGAALDLHATREELLAEAERSRTLLGELQHRIKNDFAIVNGLVHLESRSGTPEVKAALASVHRRMEALRLVHDQLHTRGRVGRVDLADYLRALCDAQAGALAGNGGVRIAFEGEPVETTHDAAIPVGLIVNELVTNAVKHAFPASSGREGGAVTVRLRRTAPGHAEVSVVDDGVGMPPAGGGRTGMKLVPMLVKQLGGEMTFVEGRGTTARLAFPVGDERDRA